MKLTRIIVFFSVTLTSLSSFFLFRVKHEVVALEKSIFSLNNSIHMAQEEMSVLTNEMLILTTPHRIDSLRQVHLKGHERLNKDQFEIPQDPKSKEE